VPGREVRLAPTPGNRKGEAGGEDRVGQVHRGNIVGMAEGWNGMR
jgi:hypothetical protein